MFPFYEQNRALKIARGSDIHFPPHLHNSVEFLFAVRGDLALELDGARYTLHDGDFAVVFPNRIHAYHGGGDYLLAVVGLEHCGGFVDRLTTHRPLDPVIPAAALHGNVGFALEELAAEAGEPPAEREPNRPAAQALTQLILARTLPALSLQKHDASGNSDLPERLLQYVGKHFREELSLELLEKQLHVSRYHLSRVFSERIGMHFTHYVHRVRLDYAAALIPTTHKPLTEIWLEAGFDSQRTFNRVFRQAYGLSPREYRG